MSNKTTGARVLAEMLDAYDTDHVFMVPAVLRRSMAEMEKRTSIKIVHTHGEKSAAYMADGYARVAGKPGVCMAQQVGALNLAAGLRDAHLANSPVIAMTGGSKPNQRYKNLYQEADDLPAFTPYTKLNVAIEDVERFPDLVSRAFREATSGCPGPVHLQFQGQEGEIDAQEGVEVDEAAVEHLLAVLARVVDKPDGIVREGGNTFVSDRTSWTADDLRAATAANRTTTTTDDRVSVHLLYVAGSHADEDGQTNAIGLAYSASTAALFPQRWQGVASLLGSARAIERAVLVHELGHLLGLVNIGYESDVDHEDPDHPGHSSNRGSVMFHAIETTLIGQVFDGPPPNTFDDADRSDLEGLRTGRL